MNDFSTFFIVLLISTAFYSVNGQFSEEFNDGDFTHTPLWSGDSVAFEVVDHMLHLNAIPEQGEAMMTTKSEVALDAVWSFELKMEFNPSSQNFIDVYLISDSKDLHGPLNGYFVRIGDFSDAVSLYRQEGDKKTAVKLIGGEENRTDCSPVNLRIRLTRGHTGIWELFSDPDMTGTFISEGTALDNTFLGSQFFGVYCHFTPTRANKFFFDNLNVSGTSSTDIIPPATDSIVLISDHVLKVLFTEPVMKFPCETAGNYRIESDGNFWSKAQSVQSDSISALISFDKGFENEENYQLCVDRLVDNSLNASSQQCFSFICHLPHQAGYRDIVINELMVDPYPPAGLPNAEYVELFNRSKGPINLANWRLNGAGNDPFQSYLLQPGAYIVLAKASACLLFKDPVLSWGNSGSLLNEGEKLYLQDASGHVIDSLQYDHSWYRDVQKKNGGWSMELINPASDCSGPDNWKASQDTTGGTPGRKNSVYDTSPDLTPPELTGLDILDSVTLVLTFSEWPAQFSGTSFLLRHGTYAKHISTGPDFNQLQVFFQMPFEEGKTYELELNKITDCAGNGIETTTRAFKFDTQPPYITSVIPLTKNKIKIIFNEKIERISGRRLIGYEISPSGMQPEDIKTVNDSSIYLIFTDLFQERVYTLSYSGISDLYDNTVEQASYKFNYLMPVQPSFNDVVISEIMADPEPVQGLPTYEYIEFNNISGHRIGLVDALLQVGQKQRTIRELFMEPGEYVVLCSPSGVQFFNKNVHVEGLSNWPSLKNRGDTVLLYRSDGQQIFAMAYDESWYQSMSKQDGGWSLEMIDVTRGCAGKDNWMASEDPAGGTPGRENYNHWLKPDLKGPELLDAGAPDSASVILHFSERLNPQEMSYFNVVLTPTIGIAKKKLIMPLGYRVRLQLNDAIQPGITYTLEIDHAVDCSGNLNSTKGRTATFVLPQAPDAGDIIINEILFHPRAGGVEFVELYNRSNKHINLQNLTLAIEKEGKYLRKKTISNEVRIYEPGRFLALTKNAFILKGDYPMGNMNAFFQMPLPQLNNEEGTIVLFRSGGEIIDKVYYNENFHHPLITNPAGVSLERTSFEKAGEHSVFWHSAASQAGYATPGKMNSQHIPGGNQDEYIKITPRVIAPNSPGIRDFAEIHFLFIDPGMMATIEIYTVQGNKTKTIAKNELLPLEGSYLWHGDDDSGRGVRAGQYIVRIELYNTAGQHNIIKKIVTVGRNF